MRYLVHLWHHMRGELGLLLRTEAEMLRLKLLRREALLRQDAIVPQAALAKGYPTTDARSIP